MWSPTWLISSVRRTRLVGLACAVVLAEALALGARLLLGIRLQAPAGTVSSEPLDITPLTIAIASVAAPLLGWALLAILERFAARAHRIWLALALLALVASFAGPLGGSDVATGDRLVLLLMHVAVGSTVITVLYTTSVARAALQSTRKSTGAHARHRPPLHTDPTRTTPPVSFGTLYPLEDVVAVIDDPAQAQRAEAALHAAGISEEDSDVLAPAFVMEGLREIERRRGWPGRLAAGLSKVVSDDAEHMDTYRREAQAGHSLVVVHAPTAAIVEQVRQVLSAHGAHGIRHFGRFGVNDLS